MALSQEQKNRLDAIITSKLDELSNKGTMYSDVLYNNIVRDTNYTLPLLVSIQSIYSSLKRVTENNTEYQTIINASSGRHTTITITKGKILSDNFNFVKEKNILKFECYNGLEYDFIAGSFNMPINEFYLYKKHSLMNFYLL